MSELKLIPENETLLEGMRRAAQCVSLSRLIEIDEELVIARDGRPVRVKVPDL